MNEINKLLIQKETLLDSIIESSPDVIIFALDKNYRYISFNTNHKQAMKHIWGKEIREGDNMLDVIGLETDRLKAKENFDRVLSGEHIVLMEEYGDERLSRQYWADYYSPLISPWGEIMGLSCFVLNQTKQRQAEDRVRRLLDEKDMLLKEVHHRIKNNMNTVYSLLKLQSGTMDETEAKQKIEDAAGRIQSMMVLYEKLFQSETILAMSLASYLDSLVQVIKSALPDDKILIETDINEIILDSNTLSTLGIIINELITNSIKHAFTEKERGKIRISASSDDGICVLVYEDNGQGIPDDILTGKKMGFGVQLIKMLVKQMGASLLIENTAGTRLRFSFLKEEGPVL